jgi:hypothetical protein
MVPEILGGVGQWRSPPQVKYRRVSPCRQGHRQGERPPWDTEDDAQDAVYGSP